LKGKEVIIMSNVTKQHVSDMLDDEVNAQQVEDLTNAFESDSGMKKTYARYALVSDILQNHAPDMIDVHFAENVSKVLDDEPTILGGFRRHLHMPAVLKQVASLAAAASITAVTILGIQSYNIAETPDASSVVASVNRLPVPENKDWVRVSGVNWNKKPSVESRLNSYLVNHNAYSQGVQGILPYAKIVSYQGNAKTLVSNESPTKK
jgi:negative regulator of sigma E activity